VYSIGSNNQFDFEEDLHARLQCETHTFDPTVEGKNALAHVTTFHKMGFIQSSKADGQNFFSIGAIIDKLGHANRTIDVFKIDCEGCEYSLFFPEFFAMIKARNVKIRQIAIEIHPAGSTKKHIGNETEFKYANDLFKLLRDNNYVIFHKEPNNLSGNCGRFVEYSFLLVEGMDCSKLPMLREIFDAPALAD